MSFVNWFSKPCRWLRWSTLLALLFYMFFIGLILHSTTYKLQDTLKSRGRRLDRESRPPQPQAQPQPQAEHQHHHQQQQQQLIQRQLHASPVQQARSSNVTDSASNSNNMNVVLDAGASSRPSEPETVIFAAGSVNEKQILAKAFRRADRNNDGALSIQELAVYINGRIMAHIEEAIEQNPREFRSVDVAPPDGGITWEEYHKFFLKEHGMSEADLDEHNEIRRTALNRKPREDLMRDKARWSEAARSDLFKLTIDDYLSFRHPESSVSNLLELVDDLLRQFDQDGDDQLTIDEFSELNVDDDDDLMRRSLISKTVVERREEFKRIIDKNHDGKADREELLHFVDPKTPRYALQEAATLFSLCDENKDGKLTLDEMTSNAEIFLTSKMIDTANSFHTEF